MRDFIIIAGVLAFAATLAIAAHVPSTVQKLELQSEARTCRKALETDLGSFVTIYCEGIIREYDIMMKVYEEEQLQNLIKRAQEKG